MVCGRGVAMGGHRHPAGPGQSHPLSGAPHVAFLRVETPLLRVWPWTSFFPRGGNPASTCLAVDRLLS